jgi:hypothetical protein
MTTIISYIQNTNIAQKESETMSNLDILVNELPDPLSSLFEGIYHVAELMKELPNTECSFWVPEYESLSAAFIDELPDASCSLVLQSWDSRQSFTCFKELPPEIRDMIWQYLLPPPRFIELDRLFYRCKGNRPRRGPIFDALQVNQESRAEIFREMQTNYEMVLPLWVGHTVRISGGRIYHHTYNYGRDGFGMYPGHDVFSINHAKFQYSHHAALQFVQWINQSIAADPRVYDSLGKIKELHILEVTAAPRLLLPNQGATDYMSAISMFYGASVLVFHCSKDYVDVLLGGPTRLRNLYSLIKLHLWHFRNIYPNRAIPEIDIQGPQGRVLPWAPSLPR